MSTHDLVLFFLQLSVMLAAALASGQVARRFHLPAVIGELIGGILLGPTAFGALAPHLYGLLFPATGEIVVAQEAVIKIGMLFFLFTAGLEVNLTHLLRRSLSIAWTSVSGIVVPLGLGAGLVLLLPDLWGPQAEGNLPMFALFVGTALSLSALPVIARILMDLDLIRSEVGVVVMAAATLSDLIGWLLFAVVLSSFAADDSSGRNLWLTLCVLLGLFALILSLGRLIGRRVIRWSRSHLPWPRGFIGVTAVMVLVAAAAVEALGVHAILGAFLVGVALSQNDEEENQGQNHAQEVIRQFVISFFAPIYFISIGLQADFVANFDLPLVLLVIAVACAGKIGGAAFGAWLGKMPPREALAVGVGLNARGAIEIILASVALDHRLIDERIYVALVVMALVTSALSSPIIQRLLANYRVQTAATVFE